MFQGRRTGRGDGRRPPSTEGYTAVRDAEGIVRQAWGSALLRWRDHMEFERRAAEEDCHAACGAVAAALRDGGAEKIAAAHAALDRAVEIALSASLACERARREVRRELDLLAGGGDWRTIAGDAWRWEGGDSRVTGRVPEIPDELRPRERARFAMRWFGTHLRSRLRRAVRVGRPRARRRR